MTPAAATASSSSTLALELLDPDHWPNPRGPVDTTSDAFAELAASIREQGLLEPIVVGPALADAGGRHPIIAGWRRYNAALRCELPVVAVHHRPDIDTELKALRAALAENLAREDMSPLAEASAIAKLVELGDTQVQAAAAVGVSERTARERLRLLTLPVSVREAIEAGHVPTTCTRQLQRVADVHPPAAIAIASAMATGGDVKALDLLDEQRLVRLLAQMQGPGFVQLTYSVSLKALELAKGGELGKRLRKASPHSGDYVSLEPARLGQKLLREAGEAGTLLSLGTGRGDAVFLAGAEWVERAVEAAIAKAERDAKKRADDEKRWAAQREASQGEDPVVRAAREDKARRVALTKRAKPHAIAMNTELADRLRGLNKLVLDGSAARLMLDLVDRAPNIRQVARFAGRHVTGAELSETWPDANSCAAAAALVRVCVAAVFCDPRANGKPLDPLSSIAGGYSLPHELVRDVAIEHDLLPDRAIALLAAREVLDELESYHRRTADRRRILYELTTADEPLTSNSATPLSLKPLLPLSFDMLMFAANPEALPNTT